MDLLKIITAARDEIVERPESYEFMDYCHCLTGKVYAAATGKPYDYGDNDEARAPHMPVDTTTPFGAAVEVVLLANGIDPRPNVIPSQLSHLNSSYANHGYHDDAGDDDDPYRDAAVKALDITIDHLQKEAA